MRRIVFLIYFLCVSYWTHAQWFQAYPPTIHFLQQEILIDEQIIFYYYSENSKEFEIVGVDNTLFIKGKEVTYQDTSYTEYFFPRVNLFLYTTKWKDYKDLFLQMAKNNVFDIHQSVDTIELIRFIVENTQEVNVSK